MENTKNQHETEEEFEDSLSFCDLLLDHESETSTSLHQNHPDQELSNCLLNQDLFEFSLAPNPDTEPMLNNIIFCGKIMPYKMDAPTNALYSKGKSKRSNSFHMQTSKPSLLPRATESFRYQSSKSRKHKFTIGLARIPPEMELSDIRKRQSRQAPVSMFPANVSGNKAPVVASNEGCRKGHWRLLRTLKCRSYLARGLTRAYLGCMQPA